MKPLKKFSDFFKSFLFNKQIKLAVIGESKNNKIIFEYTDNSVRT